MFTTQNRKKDETLKTLIKEIKTLKKWDYNSLS
jgi:hypothetical protein